MNKEMLLSLIHKVIKLDRGGPESCIGFLLAVEDDFVTVLTEKEGVIYYKTQHIKSLTQDSKDGLNFDIEIPENLEFIQAKDFKSLLENIKYQWIRVNRGGPEKLEGVLEDVSDDFVTIILNEEIIRLSLFHIRSISYGVKVEKEKDEEKESNENNKQKKEERPSKRSSRSDTANEDE
ncbi:hypothetical protein JFL43_21920 [Viridibacillus sp. YIM B01967]|uniref:Spore coat protein n=1 Tax=Viridibacillus soli TaxID=2798301 RepID=A0ABS1HDA3_9BACL|nr:hypothetical protein [Viridibacillus soli]MBK3497420.1 hypothetical protein [Viridibacillus soli]